MDDVLYLLQFSQFSLSPTSWDYNGVEIFRSPEEREQRMEYLKSLDPERYGVFSFKLLEQKFKGPAQIKQDPYEDDNQSLVKMTLIVRSMSKDGTITEEIM